MADRHYTLTVTAYDDYKAEFMADTRELYAGVGIALSFVAAAAVVAVAYSWKHSSCVDHERDQVLGAIAASRTTHNIIVGYICHELRNPLHVLEAWFDVLVSQVDAVKGDVSGSFCETEREDLRQATEDVKGALEQMRSTVDDVLDFRRVRLWL